MNSNEFINKVKSTIYNHKLLIADDNRPVIVALSGGADSVALLAALKELNFNCIAAHCNFHLRGDESYRDESHARNIAKKLNCKIIVKDFNTKEYCAETHQSSIEIACRDLRYNWFVELKDEYNAQAIAVGHNSDDNNETLLFNLFRGSGIAGLHGIPHKNNLNVIRPLLNCSRKEIEDYISQCKQTFITDSSNLTTEFSRNKIRNIILPEIEKWFPTAKKGIQKTISHISEQEQFYNQCLVEKRLHYSDSEIDNSINLSELIALETTPSLLLFEWYKNDGMTRTQADDIIKSQNSTGAKFISSNFIWAINKGRLYQYHRSSDHQKFSTDIEDYFIVSEHLTTEFNPTNDPTVAYFDISVLDGEPLSVRFFQHGDYIIPFGMKGRKMASDLMAEANIPAIERDKIPLLTKGNEILWIAGVRASSKYQIESNSTTFLRISLKHR